MQVVQGQTGCCLGEHPDAFEVSAADRPSHQGLAGLVQTFGLLTFSWMGLTGSLMFFYLKPGQEAGGLSHFVMEMHEIGETAIPLFLGLHFGAVVLHALFGRHLWRRMFFLEHVSH